MRTFLFAFLLICLSANATRGQHATLDSLIDRWTQLQRQNWGEELWPDLSQRAFDRSAAEARMLLAALERIPYDSLDLSGRINHALLRHQLDDALARHAFQDWLVPLNAEGGWYTQFLLEAQRTTFARPEQARRFLRKLDSFPEYADQQMHWMRRGLELGRTAPRAILQGREGVVDACIVERPEDSPFFQPFARMPDDWPAALRDSLQQAAREVIAREVTPTWERFRRFWTEEYIPGAVEAVGISAQPGGRAWYENRVRHFTTLDLTPEEVFETGMREVRRIEAEMMAILDSLGFEGSLQDFIQYLRTDPRFYARTPEELLMRASFICKKIDGKLPEFFGKLPRNSYGVAPVPAAIAPTYTGGRYSPGSLEEGRAGFYWVNTWNLPARPLYVLPALSLHEAVPGHHLQISLSQEMEGVHPFRRRIYLSAFGEGWGLYAEHLGVEMGIYEDLYEHFGRLTYEMWRACRLVVDPGIHVMGWSRQQAIDFLASHTALSLHECTTEVDRYIGWPGQAVSYKIGELKIRELRARAEQALGDRFDLRAFHDLVLSQGSVPLTILEEMVDDWIRSVQEE